MIYRVIQECIYNAIEHSGGDQVKVELKEKKDSFVIKVNDNGIGMNKEKAEKKDRHFGLAVMKERIFLLNGTMEIDSKNGTCITIEIPKK